MANRKTLEDSVGTNYSSSSSTTSSSANSSSSSSSTSPISFLFQSISAELDGQLKACPPTSANSTKSGSLLPLPSYSEKTGWWCSRPTTKSKNPSIVTTTSTTTTSVHSRPSSFSRLSSSSSSHCTHQNKNAVKDCRHQQQRHHRQRLKSLTFHLTVALIFTTFSCFPSLVGSTTSTSQQDDNERLVCMEGVSGLPGATIPRGDIFLKEGDTLEVFCKVNLTHPSSKGYNASNIDFIFTKSAIPRDQIEKNVINETTAVIRVRNMNASNPFLQCVLKRPTGKIQLVCQNQIDVGYPPLPVEDFRCLAPKWTSLNCTWKLPSNPVPTRYTLTQLWRRGSTVFQVPCPNTTVMPTSCTWHGKTEPPYRPNTDPIYVRVNGTNALKPSGVSWDYKFSLATIVIPEKPIIQFTKESSTNYVLNWTFPNYEYFAYGLHHQLSICYLYEGKEKCNTMAEKTKPPEKNQTGLIPFLIKNITLPYAYTNYTIRARLRSPHANKTEEFWSEPGIISIMTDSKIPDFPPETDLGSFESLRAAQDKRIIYVYWKSIPDHLRNGPNFHYEIDIFENDGVTNELLDKLPKKITDDYAEFDNLRSTSSYEFYISAVNSLGKSKNASKIYVPSSSALPEEPKSVSKTDSANGTFSITWRRPGRYEGIVSYTVFHCASNKPRPYPCEGRLEWDRVDALDLETMHKSFQSLTLETNHQFAVSANTQQYGSGMVWATCSLFKNRVPGKLRSVRFEESTDNEILIKWDLECTYQQDDIEGFKITYCQVEKYQADKCKDDESSVAVEGASMATYRLVKLKPYSIYMIYVSILAAAGSSPRSDPVYARTTEAAPSPPTIVNISRVTNVSAVLSIRSPFDWNGVLREYKIYYMTQGEHHEHEIREQLKLSNQVQHDFLKDVTLTNLRSNSNYTVNVTACTTNCSEPATYSFITDIGHTDIKTFPRISWDEDHMVLEWDEPNILGGPIYNFQISLRKNGELVTDDEDYPTVEYHEGTSKYFKTLSQKCEPSTNFTARIRAVTKLRTGNYLYGEWSPSGNYSCGGTSNKLLWVILVIIFIVAIAVFAYLSHVGYNYFRRMKEGLSIKLPPGLNSELNGFVHKPPPRSRSSDNGKETYAYPLQPTSTQDESKDFLSSSELNNGEAEESLIEKPYCPSPSNPLLGELDFSAIMNGNNMDDDENDITLTDFSNIQPDRCSSPSTYKKLGVQSNGSAVLIEPVAGPSSQSTPSIHSGGSAGDLSSSSPSHTISQISNKHHHPPPPLPVTNHRVEAASTSNGINRIVPDVLGSSPSSPTSLTSSIPLSSSSSQQTSAPTPPLQVAPPPAAQSSSYVKWTTLVPDMKTGDAGGVLENGSRQAPYCQVGILLDS